MKRAVFLIHGFASDRNDFMFFAPLLSARYDIVYSPNLPFHDKEEKQKMDCDTILNFVLTEFDKLSRDYDTVDVFGFSMGGALASFLAGQRNVNNLVLFSPANKYFCFNYFSARIRYNYEILKNKVDDHISNKNDIKIDDTNAVKMFFNMLLPRYTPRNLIEFSKVVKCCNKQLKQINCPTLIVWGRLDQLVPKSSIKLVASLCKNVKIKIYGDMSHYMLFSRAFYKIVDDVFIFLESNEPKRLSSLQ